MTQHQHNQLKKSQPGQIGTAYYVTRGKVETVWTNTHMLIAICTAFALGIFLTQVIGVVQEANRMQALQDVGVSR
jgi:hypothetical protein